MLIITKYSSIYLHLTLLWNQHWLLKPFNMIFNKSRWRANLTRKQKIENEWRKNVNFKANYHSTVQFYVASRPPSGTWQPVLVSSHVGCRLNPSTYLTFFYFPSTSDLTFSSIPLPHPPISSHTVSLVLNRDPLSYSSYFFFISLFSEFINIIITKYLVESSTESFSK